MAAPKKSAAAAPPSAPRKSNALAMARKAVDQVLKDDDPTVVVDHNMLRVTRPHIPTGSIVLDYLIGGRPNKYGVAPCPGWPRGAISNIYGHESSGKTTVALHAAAVVCRMGGSVCYIDWEHALDLSYAEGLGVPVNDPDKFYLCQPTTMEAGIVVLHSMAANGVDLIILDSVGACRPKDVVDRALEEQGKNLQVGLLARKWGDYLPQLMGLIAKSGSHVMGISQLRKKISTGPMAALGDNVTVQGGEAWKFYSAVRMKFTRIQSEKGKVYDALTHKNIDQMTSAKIKAKMDKSKVSASQQHEATYSIEFGAGIDDFRSLLDVACAHGVIKKAAAGWMSWERGNGEVIKVQGIPALKEALRATAGAYDELYGKAMEALKSASGNIPVVPVEDDLNMDLTGIMSGGATEVESETFEEE